VSLTCLDNGTQIATSLNPTVRLPGVCGPYNHRLTLRAIDNAGNTRRGRGAGHGVAHLLMHLR
jgi:hypothetical protein